MKIVSVIPHEESYIWKKLPLFSFWYLRNIGNSSQKALWHTLPKKQATSHQQNNKINFEYLPVKRVNTERTQSPRKKKPLAKQLLAWEQKSNSRLNVDAVY